MRWVAVVLMGLCVVGCAATPRGPGETGSRLTPPPNDGPSPRSVEGRILEARAREARGDLSGALDVWEQLVRDGNGTWEALSACARLGERLGRGDEVLTLLAAKDEDPERRAAAGWLALALGRTEEARALLETTWGTATEGRTALPLGRVRWLQGDLPAAAAAALRAVEAAPEDPEAWILLGDVRRSQGLASEAETSYRRALEQAPEDYAALVNLGLLVLDQGEAEEASSLFRAAAKVRPGAPEAWNNLGLARRALGDYEGAREAYRGALEARPDYLPALKNLGILNEKYLGLPAAALPVYGRYLERRPGDEEVERWRKSAERMAQEANP